MHGCLAWRSARGGLDQPDGPLAARQFDFDWAFEQINCRIPADVKGKSLGVENQREAAGAVPEMR
jgi:hypothetical protein